MEMIDYIRSMPDQIESMIEIQGIKIPIKPSNIIFAGMGGSAISGEFARIFLNDTSMESHVIRDYTLPAYVNANTLAFITSYSGNTEETLSAYRDAKGKGAYIIAITSGGKLYDMARADEFPVVKVPVGYPPRGALGFLFTPIVKILADNGIMPDNVLHDLLGVPAFLRDVKKSLESEESISRKLAARLYLRIPLIYTSKNFGAVGQRWRTQINENAKAFAHAMEFSEMNHNEIAGIMHPESILKQFFAVFIDDGNMHDRVALRYKLTEDLIRDSIMGTASIKAKGQNTMQRMFYLVYVGDYLSVYLAEYYKENAVEIVRISELKRRLSQ